MGNNSKNKFIAKDIDINSAVIKTLTVSSGMTLSASSAISITAASVQTLTVSSGITFSLSTSTTSITFVTNITSISTSSTQVNFTKQTAYLEYGVIRNFSTVTTTFVVST